MTLQFDSNANVEYRCYRVANANFAVDGQGASGIAMMPTMLVDSQSMVVYNGRCSRRKLRKLTLAEESANSLANSSVLAGLLTNKKLENFG